MDVVGYSRLIRADEERTLSSLRSLRAEVIEPVIAEHHGRVVKLMGDGVLAEFGSVIDAVRSALATQSAVNDRQTAVPADRRIVFRIGINLGDVVIDGDDIHGDGVNVAARLEALANPGGICISDNVYEEVRDRMSVAFQDGGEQTVKNIDRPLRVWQWPAEYPGADRPARAPAVARAISQKPPIAVVPFDNLSGDADQQYFTDGMVEEIITGLSHIRWITVIARNSSFAFRGTPLTIGEIARRLNVRYVLEGSVRRAGERVRITAQLIEAEGGGHLWADRFDGTLADIFDLQDQITAGVVGAIEPSMRKAEIERAKRKRPDDLDAYDLYLRAVAHMYEVDVRARAEAMTYVEKALEIDPNYAEVHGVAA